MSAISVEAFKTLNDLFDQLEKAGIDAECDGCSLAFDMPAEKISDKGIFAQHSSSTLPYLLNYHGVTGQIWLASPVTGAHHFRFDKRRWASTRGGDDLYTLLKKELKVAFT